MDTDLQHCVDLVRRHDRDRFLTVQFAPAPARAALYALYAFNHEVARAPEASAEPLVARMRVQWWRDALDAIGAGRPPDHPVAVALARALDNGSAADGRARGLFNALLDARDADADGGAVPEDMAQLERYLDATAGGLGVLALGLLNETAGDGATRAARHAGLAWGLTGVIRALPFQAARRRCLLPRALCDAAGLDVEALFAGRRPAGTAVVAAALAKRAREHAAAARQERAALSPRALAAVLPVTLADGHLARLAAVGFDPYHPAVARPTGPGGVLRLIWRGWRGRY